METQTVRHILFLKFVAEITAGQLTEIVDNFRALKDKIDGITGFEYGVNNSPEGLDQGFTHVIMLAFRDVSARNAYLPHPEHQKFASWMIGLKLIDQLLVVDYTPQN